MKLGVIIGIGGALTAIALGQGKPTDKKPDVFGLGGWTAESTYNKAYNSHAEITFRGRVIGIVDSEAPDPAMSPGTTILVKSRNGGSSAVDLGPTWYVSNISPKIGMNDEVTVTGSKVFIDNRSYILGRKVVKGSRVLYLRETSGFPMWIASRGHVDVAALNATPPPPNQATALAGTVQQVITLTDPQTGQPSSILVVNTPNGAVNVNLGPQWFIQRQNLTFAPGNNVSFLGQVVTPLPGSAVPLYMAQDLNYGNQVIVLRNNMGFPMWSPWTTIR